MEADYTALTEELLRLMYLMNRFKPQRRMNDAMKGEAFTIQILAHAGGPVTPTDISAFMDISTARTAATLNGLEAKGVVTRKIDVSDRRRILVELTERGHCMAQYHRTEMKRDLEALLRELGEQDAREYVRITARMVQFAQERYKPE